MAQVETLRPAAAPHVSAAEKEYFLNSLHGMYGVPISSVGVPDLHKYILTAEEDFTGASSLPTPPAEESATSEFPSTQPFVAVPGLPHLSAGAPGDLMRSRILQAAFDAEMDEADAERAFFVADLSKVYEQFIRWRRCLPEIEPFYGKCCTHSFNRLSQLDLNWSLLLDRSAVKCNPDPYVLRLLASLGTGFDCASHGEIKQVLDIGIDPSRIIFANPCKSTSFVRHAAKSGVDTMTFDNTDELYKIARTHRGARLVVRILTDDSKSLCRLGLKFGAPLATVPALLSTARQLGLNVVGVSFHVGSGCYDSNAFEDAIARASQAFGMGIEAGYRFTLLDVGGGFESPNFEQTATVLSRAIQTYFPRAKQQGVQIIAEPGRYFVSEAFQLAANVIARRVSPVNGAPTEPAVGEIEIEISEITTSAIAINEEAAEQPSVMCK